MLSFNSWLKRIAHDFHEDSSLSRAKSYVKDGQDFTLFIKR